jgi:hypothetical protein
LATTPPLPVQAWASCVLKQYWPFGTKPPSGQLQKSPPQGTSEHDPVLVKYVLGGQLHCSFVVTVPPLPVQAWTNPVLKQ